MEKQIKPHENYRLVREFTKHIPEYPTVTAVLLSLDYHDYHIAECKIKPAQSAIYTSNRILHQLNRAMEEDCIKIQELEARVSVIIGCYFAAVSYENQFIPGYLYYR